MTEDRVELTTALLAEDALIFGLRMTAGIDVAELEHRFPSPAWSAAKSVLTDLIDEDLAERAGDRVRLTVSGRLMADSVGEAIMSAMDQS